MNHHTIGKLILQWAKNTFGAVAEDPVERAARVVEEALEVGQSYGVPREMVEAILKRCYSNPPGEQGKEIGGLMVTVYALSARSGYDPQVLLEKEIERVLNKDPKHWREKHNHKVDIGASTARAS